MGSTASIARDLGDTANPGLIEQRAVTQTEPRDASDESCALQSNGLKLALLNTVWKGIVRSDSERKDWFNESQVELPNEDRTGAPRSGRDSRPVPRARTGYWV